MSSGVSSPASVEPEEETFTVYQATDGTGVTVDREQTLEALYNINKHAKKYAELGTENYRRGKKTTAKANSLKKDALYTLKERVLDQIHTEAEQISVHIIHGSEFYFFDYGEFSYHAPMDNMTLPDVDPPPPVELEDFQSDATKERSDKSLKECLLFFELEFGLNTNAFLDQKSLSYGYNQHFIGWEYLGKTSTTTQQTNLQDH